MRRTARGSDSATVPPPSLFSLTHTPSCIGIHTVHFHLQENEHEHDTHGEPTHKGEGATSRCSFNTYCSPSLSLCTCLCVKFFKMSTHVHKYENVFFFFLVRYTRDIFSYLLCHVLLNFVDIRMCY